MSRQLASRMKQVQPSAIRDLLQLGADPRITSFAGGYPDATLFPLDQLAQVFETAIRGRGRDTLQYTVSNGMLRLRELVATRLARDKMTVSADNILILQGSQQGLDLVAKMYIDKGDVIVTESPTFLGALIAFNPCEPRYAGARMDSDGMDMDDLERLLKRNPGVKLLYTIPDFQNPTGATMSLPRRQRLIELANAHDFMILEDTAYRELRYEGEPVPTLKSLDTQDRVICLGTFSKILSPGLRIGWAAASTGIIEQLGLLKLAADTQCSTLNMAAVSLFLERHDIDEHIAKLRNVYRRKRDVMLDTIRRTFPQDVSCSEPSGGLFTWLTFAEGFDTARFMMKQALPKARIAYVPGATFFPVKEESNHARLNYSSQPDDVIVRGITALGNLLKNHA